MQSEIIIFSEKININILISYFFSKASILFINTKIIIKDLYGWLTLRHYKSKWIICPFMFGHSKECSLHQTMIIEKFQRIPIMVPLKSIYI